jgi:hypothetical protein
MVMGTGTGKLKRVKSVGPKSNGWVMMGLGGVDCPVAESEVVCFQGCEQTGESSSAQSGTILHALINNE